MTPSSIGAVAVEDESISFARASSEHNIYDLYRNFCGPDKFVSKPEAGYSRLFIEKEIREFFDNTPDDFQAIGISMFGVIDTVNSILIDIPSRDWFEPEFKSWRESNLDLRFKEIFGEDRWKNTRISVLNDATTAALGEYSGDDDAIRNESHYDRGDVFAYVHAASGINAGILRNGYPIRYRIHPEIGHIRPMRHLKDLYQGCCDYHRNCFEGLASLRAIKQRMESSSSGSEDLEPEIWDIQAYYLAQICIILNMTVAPNRIVLGGTAMRDHLLDPIREYFAQLVGDYPRYKENLELQEYIRPAKVDDHTSLRGALWLANFTAEGREGF